MSAAATERVFRQTVQFTAPSVKLSLLEGLGRSTRSQLLAVTACCSPQSPTRSQPFSRLSRLAWAMLYQRVFDIDPLECASCGGRMRFVEVIEDEARARSELRRRNLPDAPPPLARAHAPDWTD